MSSSGKYLKLLLAFFLLLLAIAPLFLFAKYGASAKQSMNASTVTHHYLYVFPDGGMNVYDMDNGHSLVKSISLPTSGVRGVVADPASGMLYISYHGDGGAHGNGSMLKYNLLNDTIVWTKDFSFGVDSMAITPDGKTIYMPDGVLSYDGIWHVLHTSDGSTAGSIFVNTGAAAHNTVVSLNGSHAYLGALNYNYLVEVDTATNTLIKRIGPLKNGVRPFTINGTETLAFTTATGFLGFEVSSITTGKLLYTVPISGFTSSAAVPSHGVSLSPDEKEAYVIDSANSYVHVFDVSRLPGIAPKQIADIPVRSMAGPESPCAYDCTREGWVLHSRDGRFVYVGDSGDVIDTTTRKSVVNLSTLYNTRKYIEIDWANGTPSFATSRHGMGYVTGGGPTTPTPTPQTPTPSPSPSLTPSPSPTVTVTPSSTPGTILALDTFQRTNQAHWGTASDGHSWGGDANTASVFSIVSNTGQVSNTSTSYSSVLGPSATNAEVVFSGSMSNYSSNNLGAVLRWRDGNNWYKAYINGTTLVAQKKVNGATTIIGSASFTAKPGTSYTLRFRVVGTTLYARAWQTGTTEPSNWMIMVTDTSFSSGFCGLRMLAQNGAIATYTSFQASTQ